MASKQLHRRGFVQAAALGMVGAALGRPRSADAAMVTSHVPGDEPVRVGLASYSLRKYPRAKAIEISKALGVKYINIKSVHLDYPLSAAELAAGRAEFENAGLTIVGGGTITFGKDTDEDVRSYFEYAKHSGMPVIVATADPVILPRIERFAKQYDIKVAIHNHGPEDKRYPSPYDVLKYVKNMDRRMGLCIDVGHTVRTGTDVVKAIADAGPRVLDLHMKDLRVLSDNSQASRCVVGDGAIPIAAIFHQLQASGFTGYANLEYELNDEDPVPGIHRSLSYMRGVVAGLAAASPSRRPTKS